MVINFMTNIISLEILAYLTPAGKQKFSPFEFYNVVGKLINLYTKSNCIFRRVSMTFASWIQDCIFVLTMFNFPCFEIAIEIF